MTLTSRLHALSIEELRAFVRDVVDVLYHNGPETEWSADTPENVALVLEKYGLEPSPGEDDTLICDNCHHRGGPTVFYRYGRPPAVCPKCDSGKVLPLTPEA